MKKEKEPVQLDFFDLLFPPEEENRDNETNNRTSKAIEQKDYNHEPRNDELDLQGGGSLETVSTDDVSDTQRRESPGSSTQGRSIEHSQRDQRLDGAGDRETPSLADGSGEIPNLEGGTGRVRTGSERSRNDTYEGDTRIHDGSGGDQEQNRTRVVPQDYVIPGELGQGGAKTKFQNNIAAIRLLKSLQDENRPASISEQSVLANYVGWGGIPQAFYKPNGEATKGWESETSILKSLLTDIEYKSARSSTQNAHYTSTVIVSSIYKALSQFGFEEGRILEPSLGLGHFIGLMPESLKLKSEITGVELDTLTGDIAKVLYPTADIHAPMGFQQLAIPNDYFDLVVGNPPFGNERVFDPIRENISDFSIHNYFFAKSIDALRPGGLLAMVVSNFLMDKKSDTERQYFAEKTKLLSAIRLPNTAFLQSAGTEVTTDIVFLQKRMNDDNNTGFSWNSVEEITGPDNNTIPLNEYYVSRPEMMLGTMTLQGSMYRKDFPALIAPSEQNLQDALDQAIQHLPSDVATPVADRIFIQSTMNVPKQTKMHGFFTGDDGCIYRRIPDLMGKNRAELITKRDQESGKELPLAGIGADRIKGLIRIRDSLRSVLQSEIADENEEKIEANRQQLNRHYDEFVNKLGPIHEEGNRLIFRNDPEYPLLLSIEINYIAKVTPERAKKLGVDPQPASAEKAPIFFRRVNTPFHKPDRADNAMDALSIALNEHGRVELDRMQELTGRTHTELVGELDGLLFADPVSGWVTKDEYLSGNVKEKLSVAQQAAVDDERFIKNVRALETVQPKDIDPIDISIRINSPWTPGEVIEDFITHLLRADSHAKYVSVLGLWNINIGAVDRQLERNVWGTNEYPATKLIDRILNDREIKVQIKFDNKTEMDREATLAANAKAEEIKQEFQDWVWEDKPRRDRLARIYNDRFNAHVDRHYDGSHLAFPGKVPDDVIKLNAHQSNSSWRIIQDGNTLLDQVVGSGKTYTMIAAAMEMRRMGLAKKPMFVVPNHLVEQWSKEFYSLYPAANVLMTTKRDFKKEHRRVLFARITTGEWDAVIVAHSSFGFIKPPEAQELVLYEKQIDDIRTSIELSDDDWTTKRLEKMIDRIKVKRDKAKDMRHKDDVVDFLQLGVDALFVDEAHEFKNVFYSTKHSGIAGLGSTKGAQKASDLFIKCRILQHCNNGRGVVFATGTPISNTIAEMYTMQRYLDYDNLAKVGLTHFDAWANTFANKVSAWELDSTGVKYKLNTRFSSFVNLPELMSQYRRFADTVSLQDLKNKAHEQGNRWPVPNVHVQNVIIPRNPMQSAYMASIIDRAENLKNVDPSDDNMLKITNDARKAGLDMRLIIPNAQDDPANKVNVSAGIIYSTWEQWNDLKGTQLVFIDLSVPGKFRAKESIRVGELIERAENGDNDAEFALSKMNQDELISVRAKFSVYDALKTSLIDMGMPSEQIAFIHDANTAKQKHDLFDAVRNGKIRVLIGSTPKMGAGTNVQNRLVASHHLDCPWRPSDLEQRDGRIIRQGNEFFRDDPDGFEVDIYRYATEQTYDSRMWQTIETKARFIEQIRNASGEQREIEDVAGQAASAAEMKAAASGNPLILEQVELDMEVKKLDMLLKSHRRKQHQYEQDIAVLEVDGGPQAKTQKRIQELQNNIAIRNKNSVKEGFYVTIQGHVYDNRSQAGKVFCERIEQFYYKSQKGGPKEETVFNYRGFDISLHKVGLSTHGMSSEIDVVIESERGGIVVIREHYAKFNSRGIFTRIDNTLHNFESEIEWAKNKGNEDQRNLDIAKENVNKPFPQMEELEPKRKRLKEVIDLLQNKEQLEKDPQSISVQASEEVKHENTNPHSKQRGLSL